MNETNPVSVLYSQYPLATGLPGVEVVVERGSQPA